MISIVNMGCDCLHPAPFCIQREYGCGCWMMLYIKTKAWYIINGQKANVEPGTWLLLRPDTPHAYGHAEGLYRDDWIMFDSTEEIPPMLVNRLYRTEGVIRVDLYMQLICDTFYRNADEHIVSQLIHTMLEDIRAASNASLRRTSFSTVPLLELRKEIYAYPQHHWTIKSMAERTMLSTSYFQSQYRTAFGVSPMADVINSRVEMAKALLSSTDLSIADIGYRCGYASNVHFTRQFRSCTGMSPTEHRIQGRKKSAVLGTDITITADKASKEFPTFCRIG